MQDFWTINSTTSLITLPMGHPWDWYIYLHEWLIFMGHVYREIHPSQECYGLLAENCAQKATNHSHLDLNAQQLQMRLPSTLFSLLQTCDSLDGSEGLGILDKRLCFFHFYISAPPWKSLYLQNITQCIYIYLKQLKSRKSMKPAGKRRWYRWF